MHITASIPLLKRGYAIVAVCILQYCIPFCSAGETCAQVMQYNCQTQSSNICLDLSFKLIAIGTHCLSSTSEGSCMPDCAQAISEVLEIHFGYRMLTCDCSDPGSSFIDVKGCETEQSYVDICRHVIFDWCTEAVDQCMSDDVCREAKVRFEQDCSEEYDEVCLGSLRNLYLARTSDRLVCDCDFLFNSSTVVDESRDKMLDVCSGGIATTVKPVPTSLSMTSAVKRSDPSIGRNKQTHPTTITTGLPVVDGSSNAVHNTCPCLFIFFVSLFGTFGKLLYIS